MGNKYSKGLIAKFFSPIRELLFRNIDLLLPVSLSSWTWSKMERDNLIPFSLPSFLLELFHMSRCCWEDGLRTRANCDVRTPGKEREKPQTDDAVGMRLLGQRIMRKRGPVPMREVGIIHRTRWGIASWGILTVYTPAPLSTHSFPVGTEKMARLELMLIYQALMKSFKQKKTPSSHSERLCHTPTTAWIYITLKKRLWGNHLVLPVGLPFKSHRCLSCPKAIRSDV